MKCNEHPRPPLTDEKLTRLESLVRQVLEELGEDPDREGLVRTPHRVAKAWAAFTSGTEMCCTDVLNGAVFTEKCDEMVVVKDIELYSLCEHHMVPFFGKAHVAYLPGDKIIGLSKLARIVDLFSRRLQVQERLTTQIANCLEDALKPQGVAVIIEAQHLCMMMRGVQKQNSMAVTSCMLGVFKDDLRARDEFLQLTRRSR
jgi:GTP cyclohydrolase I